MTAGRADPGSRSGAGLIDIAVILHHETELAYLVDAGGPKPVWLPKSQVEMNDDGTATLPEWLALEKGLI